MTVQEARALWIAALKSGDWEQGRQYLCKDGQYCCLGVVCEIYIREGIGELEVSVNTRGIKEYRDTKNEVTMKSGLPNMVADWLGVKGMFGLTTDGRSLTIHNDDGKSFVEIANLVENEGILDYGD